MQRFSDVIDVITEDFAAFNKNIGLRLHSDAPLVSDISLYILGNGGKRLRPLIALLVAKACNYEGTAHIELATVIEYLHTATLLHDDVVDQSDLRRGKKSANLVWTNSASILVGDFLISRAFQLVVSLGNLKVLRVLGDATNQIAEGEVLQLSNCHNPDVSEQDYLRVISQKTAKMFEAGAQCAAILANSNSRIEKAAADYAMHLGMAFQLIDDLLDFTGKETLGKNIGDDLAEGKPTLPVIFALTAATPAEKKLLQEAIVKGSTENLPQIQEILQRTRALAHTEKTAAIQAELAIQALEPLGKNPFTQALKALANLSVDRDR